MLTVFFFYLFAIFAVFNGAMVIFAKNPVHAVLFLILTFFNAALMQDPESALQKQGPNTKHPDCLRFTDNDAPAAMEPVIRAYLAESMGYAERGILPTKEPSEVDMPPELIEALE